MKNNVLTSSLALKMTMITTISLIIIILFSDIVQTEAQVIQQPRFIVLVNQNVFVPGDILVVYGKSFPDDLLFIRIFDPVGKVVRLETVKADDTGTFTNQVFAWPEPSRNFVYGRYIVEVSSTLAPSYRETRTVSFSDTSYLQTSEQGSAAAALSVKLDSPTEISLGQTFRIFVQVTFGGALVNEDPDNLLSSSHIHSGNSTINLAGSFNKLHEGLYYADVKLDQPGSYVIHSIAFHRGFLAHDSKVVSSGSSIGEIQETVKVLQTELESTSRELKDTRRAVDEAREAIGQDIDQAESAVSELKQASGQINAIIIPILALISIIIALQISLFARIRASFK